jgi:hypothetical protein
MLPAISQRFNSLCRLGGAQSHTDSGLKYALLHLTDRLLKRYLDRVLSLSLGTRFFF